MGTRQLTIKQWVASTEEIERRKPFNNFQPLFFMTRQHGKYLPYQFLPEIDLERRIPL
jgi:hypothetical protein